MKRLLLTTLLIAGAIAAYTSCEEQEQTPEIIKVESVTIDQSDLTLTEGESVTLTATVLPEDAVDKAIAWSSSNDDIVMIASNGKVKALAVGQAIVMAQAGGKSDFITINVMEQHTVAPSTTIGADHISAVGGTLHGSITTENLDGHYEYGFMYSTSAAEMVANPIIIKASNLDSNSTYYFALSKLSPSTTYYYRSYLNKDGENFYGRTKEFTTKDISSILETYDPTGVEASKAILNGKLDLTDVSYSNISYGYYYGTSENNLIYFVEGDSISNNTFYTSSLNNLFHNTQYWYRAYVELDYRSFFGEVKTFTTGVVPVAAVTLDRSNYTFHYIGNTTVISATILPYDATDKRVHWSSDNMSVATVHETGQITAVGNGSATITVTTNDQSKTATCVITVSQYVTDITFDNTPLDLLPGDTCALVAAVTPTNANDKSLNWSSDNSSVASVDENGYVTAFAKGKATITAVAMDGSGVSATCSVAVSNPCPTGAVDLGMHTQEGYRLYWATSNLSASGLCANPEDYGDYYAWGETEPKSEYSWENYKFGSSVAGPFSKYNNDSSYGTVDNKRALDPEDDAASAKLGGNWRMPTYEEWDKLGRSCTWIWTTENGVNGKRATGINGNTIFIPAAGLWNGMFVSQAGLYGDYWSSSLYTRSPYDAYYRALGSASGGGGSGGRDRYIGQSIRPVSD